MPELRQDLISGDWVIIAPGRRARPMFLDEKKKKRVSSPKSTCPFEDLQKSGNWPPLLTHPDGKNWKMVLIPNKYPAVMKSNICSVPFREGIYHARTAVGSHDLLITRDHNKNFADLDRKDAVALLEMLQAFHVMAAHDKCAAYVSSFFNWGAKAGASVWHPHYQILTLPIIPPHTAHSLQGAASYYKKNGRCARCDMIRFERKEGKRIVEENAHAIAIVPYAGKRPFEVTILPKRHYSSFAKTSAPTVAGMAALLQSVMKRMKKYLNDPDLNFFIHDAPLGKETYNYHHWHMDLLPVNVISLPGGFEAATIVNINVVDPDKAAAALRGKKW